MSVSACRCCMFVSCVHPVAVLNTAFCMTCSDCVGVCGNICCVAAVVKDSVYLALEC